MTDFEIEQVKRTLIDQKLEFQENYVDFGGVVQAYDYAIECIEWRQKMEEQMNNTFHDAQISNNLKDRINADAEVLANVWNISGRELKSVRDDLDEIRLKIDTVNKMLKNRVKEYDKDHKMINQAPN